MSTIKKEKPKHYCTNKNLLAELVLYHKTDIISEDLGRMFLDIASRFTNRSNWKGYPQCVKDDFISEAVLRMISQIDKFDVNRKTYLRQLKEPYTNKKGDLVYTELVAISILDGEKVQIDKKTYKRMDNKLINVQNDDDTKTLREGNPFAYLTQIVYHKYVMEVKKYYKQINIQREMCNHFIEEIECNAHMSEGFLKQALQDRVDELG